MITPNFDISLLTDAIGQSLDKSGISKWIHPKGISKDMDDYVIIRPTLSHKDEGGIAKVICPIELYAKDDGDYKNTIRLHEMYSKMNEVIKHLTTDFPMYKVSSATQFDKGSNGIHFHATGINLFIIITKT